MTVRADCSCAVSTPAELGGKARVRQHLLAEEVHKLLHRHRPAARVAVAAVVEHVQLLHLPGVHAEDARKLRRRVLRAVNGAVDDPAQPRDLLLLRLIEQTAAFDEEVYHVLHRHLPLAA